MPSVERRLPLQWSLFADRMLRQMAPKMDALSLASRLGRTPMEVRARALALGIELRGEADVMDRPWGSGEVAFLRQQFRRMPPAEIARQLGRSPGAVQSKIWSLGLRKRRRSLGDPVEPDPAFSAGALGDVHAAGSEPSLPAFAPAEPEPEPVPAPEPAADPWPEPEEPKPEPEPEPEPAPRPFRWWTADEDERLRQFVKDRVPLPELAELFGRREAEVARRIARICTEPDPPGVDMARRRGAAPKKPRAKPSGPIPEERLASMSKMDVLRALAGLA